jgi:branched-chain amino acid transport system permease protein
VDPGDSQYGVSRAVQILTFAVLGGSGNIFGPVVGALFLTMLPEIIRQAADYRDVVSGVVLIAVIVFRPQGIVGRGGLAIVRPRWWPRPQPSAPSPG